MRKKNFNRELSNKEFDSLKEESFIQFFSDGIKDLINREISLKIFFNDYVLEYFYMKKGERK